MEKGGFGFCFCFSPPFPAISFQNKQQAFSTFSCWFTSPSYAPLGSGYQHQLTKEMNGAVQLCCLVDLDSWQDPGFCLFPFALAACFPQDTTLPVCSLPAQSFLKHPSLKSPDLFSALLNKSLKILLTHASVPGLLRTLDAILETCQFSAPPSARLPTELSFAVLEGLQTLLLCPWERDELVVQDSLRTGVGKVRVENKLSSCVTCSSTPVLRNESYCFCWSCKKDDYAHSPGLH